MNNNHNIKDLDLLYSDAKKLIDGIVSEKIDGYDIVEIADNGYGQSIFAGVIKSTFEEIINDG